MIAAVVALCLVANPLACESHQIRVERRACAIKPLRTEVSLQGAWQPGILSIKCAR